MTIVKKNILHGVHATYILFTFSHLADRRLAIDIAETAMKINMKKTSKPIIEIIIELINLRVQNQRTQSEIR